MLTYAEMDSGASLPEPEEECVPIVINTGSSPAILDDTKKSGTLPTEARMNSIFQRMITQLDFISRTIGMMNERLDCLQSEVDEMRSENNC